MSECHGLYGEAPDAIGFRNGYQAGSILVECKVSRADFRADRAKPHRAPGAGMGTWRYFMAPVGLITIDELPARWGLLKIDLRGRVRPAAGAAVSIGGRRDEYAESLEAFRHTPDAVRERELLVQLLSRLGDVEAANLRVREAIGEKARLGREVDRLRREARERDTQVHVLRLELDSLRRNCAQIGTSAASVIVE